MFLLDTAQRGNPTWNPAWYQGPRMEHTQVMRIPEQLADSAWSWSNAVLSTRRYDGGGRDAVHAMLFLSPGLHYLSLWYGACRHACALLSGSSVIIGTLGGGGRA